MSHMVIYRGADGKPGYHQTDDIHDAVGFVEQMRNDEGVEHARIFRLEEVVFEYRPYYRVEIAAAGAPMVLGAPPAAQLSESETAPAIGIPAVATPPTVDNGGGSTPVNGVPPTPESIDLIDEVVDVADQFDDSQPKVDAGVGKKGLFGR